MREIPLNHGKVALVDDDDYERVIALKWRASQAGGLWYAVTARCTFLHRFILNPPDDIMVDHKNRDGLDCRRENMRLATNAQNQHNAKMNKRNKSGYRGVCQIGKTWRAHIQINHATVHLGMFATPEDAARAYDAKVKEVRGEFGRTNF